MKMIFNDVLNTLSWNIFHSFFILRISVCFLVIHLCLQVCY